MRRLLTALLWLLVARPCMAAPAALEVYAVSVDRGHVRLVSRQSLPLSADPTDVVRHAVQGLDPAPLVIHSTAWRYEQGTVVLTYAACLHAGAGAAVGRRASPALAQTLHHLSFLLQHDTHVQQALPPAWRAALQPWGPRPFAGEEAFDTAAPDRSRVARGDIPIDVEILPVQLDDGALYLWPIQRRPADRDPETLVSPGVPVADVRSTSWRMDHGHLVLTWLVALEAPPLSGGPRRRLQPAAIVEGAATAPPAAIPEDAVVTHALRTLALAHPEPSAWGDALRPYGR